MEKILKLLFEKQDLEFRDFQAKLIPTLDKQSVIGVRTPHIVKIAKKLNSDKEFFSAEERKDFLEELPHKYFEENRIHGELISAEKSDFNKLIEELDEFLPYVDNWAVCDMIHPALFKKRSADTLVCIRRWLKSEHIYTVRFAVDMLLANYLDDNFSSEIIDLVKGITSDEYYVNMALAWFWSFALIKQYDSVIGIFENQCLDIWVHNKSIQKATESYRVEAARKEYLRSLKIK